MSIERQARDRRDFNQFSRTNRPLTSDAEALGISGEIAFAARMLGKPSNWQPPTRRRTPGYQFTVGPWRVKIVTSHRPGTLFVKQDGVEADVYILAGCPAPVDWREVWWCGWASRSDVLAAPVGVANRGGDYVLPSHAIKRPDLSPMGSLAQILGLQTPEALSLMDEWDVDRGLRDVPRSATARDPEAIEQQGDLL